MVIVSFRGSLPWEKRMDGFKEIRPAVQLISEENIKMFLTGFLTGQNCFRISRGSSYDRNESRDYWYFIISLGTYGDNYYGQLVLKTYEHLEFTRVLDDVMSFYNQGVVVDKKYGITVKDVVDGFNCEYVDDDGVNVRYYVKTYGSEDLHQSKWVVRCRSISDRYGREIVDEYAIETVLW